MLRHEMPGARQQRRQPGADARPRTPRDWSTKRRALDVRARRALEADIALARDLSEDVLALGRRAADIRDDIKFMLRADDAGYVYYLEIRGRGVFLRASPIDVSTIVRDVLFDRLHGDRADLRHADRRRLVRLRARPARAATGAARSGSTRSSTTRARRSSTCRARCRTRGRRNSWPPPAGEVIEILKRTRGRAFVLFTSYANLREVHRIAAAELEYPMLVQGSAPRSALLREFKATPNAVLFATSSFWQGVDVVGDALSCVIIDKLPFASPGDPITAARIEAIGARRRDRRSASTRCRWRSSRSSRGSAA